MKKKKKKNYKKIYKKWVYWKMLLLSFKLVMIYIIYKILVLLKNHQNYLKDNILECFFKKYNRLLVFLKKVVFFHNI